MKDNKLSLSKLSFINSVITTIVLTLVFIGVGVYEYKGFYEDKMRELKSAFISKNKNLIKEEVKSLSNRIDQRAKRRYSAVYKVVDDRVTTAKNLFESHLQKDLNAFYHILASMTFETTPGYFFVFNEKGDILFHQSNQEFIGQNIFTSKIVSDEAKSFAEEAIATGISSQTYRRHDKKLDKKIVLHVNIQKLYNIPIYIAHSIYMDKIDKGIEEDIFPVLKKERFGYDGYGYFWITQRSDTMIFHPISEKLIGQKLTNLKDKNGIYIFNEINNVIKKNGEGYLEYLWEIPGTNTLKHKTSYVKALDYKDWIVGAGFYLEDFEKQMRSEQLQLNDFFRELTFSTILFLLLISGVVLIFSWRISEKFKKIEEAQKRDLNLLEQYKLILDSSNIVSKTDLNGKMTYVNDLFEKVSGFKREQLIGKSHRVVKHPSTPRETFKSLWGNISEGKVWQGLIKNRKKGREGSYYCQTTIAPIKDEYGKTKEYIAVCIDVTEMITQKNKISKIFLTDTLTSLGSRVKLLEKLSSAKNSQIALIDIDSFTRVNDTFGNTKGDEILREVAKRLYFFTSSYEVSTYRIHADVFAIYSHRFEKKNFEQMITETIKFLCLKGYGDKEDIQLHFTAGIAYGDDKILAYGDIALKSAKNSNKQIVVYDEADSTISDFEDGFIWVKKLSEGLAKDKIVPYFQPIYNYETQKVDKYEALMRYIDDDGAPITPIKFLDIAKKTKIYPNLTQAIVSQAVHYFSNFKELKFSINLTLEDLLNNEVMQHIFSILDSNAMFKRVVFEIVESEELVTFEQVKEILSKFKQEGVQIAVDDFGSGYSNYSYLLELEVDFVKIDGSIIKRLKNSQPTRDLVASIVAWAKKSNVKTIAEFISNKELDQIAKDLGVDFAQGYHYGAPEQYIDES